MRIRYDRGADAAYVYLVDEIRPGEAKRQVVVDGARVILDFDDAGELLGVAILGAAECLRPETLAHAKVSDWVFRVVEVSVGVYEATGRDSAGRSVSAKGTDSDAVLRECPAG